MDTTTSRIGEMGDSACDKIHDVLKRHEPAVFRQLIRDWDLVQRPAESPAEVLDRMARIVGHRVVPVTTGLPGDQGAVASVSGTRGRATSNTLTGQRQFSDIVREIKAESASPSGHFVYAPSIVVETTVPELLPLLKLPFDEEVQAPGGHWRMWLGSGRHHVNLHYDRADNFYCVLTGTKRFTVFPPEVLPFVYPRGLGISPFGTPTSVVDPGCPDLARFPKFSRALAYACSVDLFPGDAFFLPTNWWHHVESFGINASVNYWWSDLDEEQHADANTAFLEATLALRSLPPHWRRVWKQFFDHFVFQVNGDPYEHLPPEEQGYLGSPTHERLETIRAAIARRRQPTQSRLTSEAALLNTRYCLSPTMAMRILPSGAYRIVDWTLDVDVEVSASVVELLRDFARPTTGHQLLASASGQNLEEAQIIGDLRELTAARVLVRCDAADDNPAHSPNDLHAELQRIVESSEPRR